jgi:hypothetical protein
VSEITIVDRKISRIDVAVFFSKTYLSFVGDLYFFRISSAVLRLFSIILGNKTASANTPPAESKNDASVMEKGFAAVINTQEIASEFAVSARRENKAPPYVKITIIAARVIETDDSASRINIASGISIMKNAAFFPTPKLCKISITAVQIIASCAPETAIICKIPARDIALFCESVMPSLSPKSIAIKSDASSLFSIDL